jgi:hypothetical protein
MARYCTYIQIAAQYYANKKQHRALRGYRARVQITHSKTFVGILLTSISKTMPSRLGKHREMRVVGGTRRYACRYPSPA